jgi:hypothetical protein
MMESVGMITNGRKMEPDTRRIVWTHGVDYWLTVFVGHVFFIIFLIVSCIDTPKAFFYFSIILYFSFFIFTLLVPNKIVIDADILSIFLIGRIISIQKSDIVRINAFKLKGVRGRMYYFKIISNRPLSIRFGREMFPLFIHYDFKPYHNVGPSRIYDIVEAIENWFNKDNSVK